MTQPSDKELIQAVLAGEKTGYEKLYDRYGPLVRAICYDTTHNLTDAQDLAQDVFMRGYERLGRLRDRDRFGKWIVGIARLRCKEWRRRRSQGRDRYVVLEEGELAIANPSNDGRIEQLQATITKLPEKERLALHIFYLQGKSANNSHRIMGLSRSGFYRVLERARKKLERLLVQE
ncbi:MAG: sigma-70 family RNA polymerase sigma factor [Phycisphaerae bacterium]|nr:sigma-70 family RNA polymerase sigma factor [Phycisphaerae bacterium]NIP52836.1 sigma-70 family RNA polymerase sigma factor [Phycisphaerae bacterium]NIS51857.1 sigma-70 family RNA polymerase sigma factor [Phycisphaerae bacterium]NIU09375.1 sigma-70 family RNA polymerase sigma factor [Phycisphaerae bacterium]NIU57608.1 sigma-70 family RNA polymerase sigma factor [Phycisphaerae bacterium]